ncbi:hypothetical protein [Pedobacter xixiisoli]|uniref:Uncharacterized protein n=1 Tax=Pedobacter xixiisoli TaxID=1476464 RepID=A0A285ZTY5_9SPHI|nr:hypothetical protein [Pedobacter xixiisoli]SOD13092.1 hypothetical protein SAMN06297358_1005 [Pedobacter xixiisoli]
MAILHRKEEKIQVVLGRLPKKYTHDEFVEMFIKLYSKDWGKIKSAYIKQNQDKEPGTVVNMPKPDLYLRQVLDTYLATKVAEPVIEKAPVAAEEPVAKKAKAAPKKKAEAEVKPAKEVKVKAVAKKKAETDDVPVKEVKVKAAPKKKVTAEKAPAKAKKAKTTES